MGFKLYEKILLPVCGVSIILKFLKVPGSMSLCAFSFAILIFTYFFAGWHLFSVKENGAKQNNIAHSIFAGFALAIMATGILFKTFSWNFYTQELFCGFSFSSILLVVCIALMKRSNLKLYYSTMIKRSMIFISVGILVLLLPVKHYSYTKEGIRTQIIQNPDGTKTQVIDTGSAQ